MTSARHTASRDFSAVALCLLCAVAMAYGWGWRGSYGHERGAMLPGALLGMALCLGSGRADLYRRTAVAGLFGAVGWAFGGAMSYMEHTFYVVSDSAPDVLWGFSCIFLIGALWSGMGSAILSLALTRPRSELNGFLGPFAANGAALLLIFLYFFLSPAHWEAVEDFGVRHFHDGEFLSATVVLVVSGAYWIARPVARVQAGLFAKGAAAWWAGYLAFTKFGGIVLAPPYRSESWGGFIAVLAVLIHHLAKQRNRAGFLITFYGALAGGVGFVLALLVRHPILVRWGPWATSTTTITWKWAEESFGFFMGLGVALAVVRVLRGQLVPPDENVDRTRSDTFSAFVLLIAVMWMNLRRNVVDWGHRYDVLPHHRMAGLWAWQWFFVVGVFLTALGLYVLWKARKGDLKALIPETHFGKGALLFLLVLWIAQFGVATHRFADWKQGDDVLVEVSYWLLAIATTWLLLARSREGAAVRAGPISGASASDRRWCVGGRYWLCWALVPVLVVTATLLAMGMQEGPHRRGRLRFGPEAYWRLELRQ